MAERYSLRIGEQPTPAAYGRGAADGAAMGVQVGHAIQGIGGAVQDMSAMLIAREDKQANYDAMAALRDYKREMLDYLNNPETGAFNARKLSGARGLTGDVDSYAGNLAANIRKNLSPRAAEKFDLIEQETRMPFISQSSHFEAAQGREYENMTFQTTLEGNANEVAAMPYNQEAFDSAAREGVLAIEIHMRGAPESAIRLAQKGYVSGLEKSRISAAAQDDPVSAMAMLDASDVLLPADRAALRASLEPKARKMEVQSIVDGIVAENGIENRFEILKAIHANYSGDTEDALIAEYNQRHGEYAAEENRKAAEAQAYRAQFYQGVYDAYQRDFKYIPMDEIDRWYDAGYIDSGQRDRLIGYNGNVASISYQENRVRAEHPDWTPEQVQIGARGNLGITPEVMEDAQKFYMRGIVTGTVTMAEVNDAHANGFLTNRQKDQLTEFEKGYTAEAKGMIGGASRDLNAALDRLSGATLSPEAREAAVDAFMTGLAGLTPADREKLPESLRNLQTQALVKAAQTDHENMLNKEDLNTEDAYDNLQDAYDKNLRRLTEPRANSYEFTPEAQRLFAPDPPPPGDEARAFNSALFQASGKYKGLPYELGGKGVGAGGIDCSGLVSVAMPNAMKKVNEQAGQEVFGKDAMDAVRGSAADILRKVEQATGTQAAVNPPLLHYRPGMIIALGPRAGERRNGRHKDITHVSMVIQDNAGRLMVYESNSYQGGVVIRPLEAALNEYRGRPVYAADPMLMARGRKAALPSPAPRPPISSLDSVGKPPAQPEGQK